jgi:hypothetical protein
MDEDWGTEPQDAVPEGYLEPQSAEITVPRPRRASAVVLRVAAYGIAAAWPFAGTYYEYVSQNDSGALSNACDDSGCVAAGTEFAHNAVAWLAPLAVGSLLVVLGMDAALHTLRARRRRRVRGARVPSDKPVNRFVLAGMFVLVCVLALLIGVLRGMIINDFGH